METYFLPEKLSKEIKETEIDYSKLPDKFCHVSDVCDSHDHFMAQQIRTQHEIAQIVVNRARKGKKYFLVSAPTGIGKCLKKDTPIFTSMGLTDIQQVSEEYIEGFNTRTMKPCYRRIVGKTQPKIDTCFHVTTRRGYSIESTADHKFLVMTKSGKMNWMPLQKIGPGDYVVIQRGGLFDAPLKLQETKGRKLRRRKADNSSIELDLPRWFDRDIAYFFGQITGDGHFSKVSVNLTTGDAETVNFCKRFGLIIGCKPSIKRYKDRDCWAIRFHRVHLKNWVNDNGLNGHSHERTVPQIVKKSPVNVIASYLRGLFDADGSSYQNQIEYSSSSPTLAKDVHLLLLGLGIVSTIREKATPRRMSYRISITGEDAVRYMHTIGFDIKRKASNIDMDLKRNPNLDVVPHQSDNIQKCWNQLKSKFREEHGGRPAIQVGSWNSKRVESYRNNARKPSRSTLGEIGNLFSNYDSEVSDYLLKLSESSCYFDPITSIKDIGEHEVLDIEVDDVHNFVAAGFVVHNSAVAVNIGHNLHRQTVLCTPYKSLQAQYTADFPNIKSITGRNEWACNIPDLITHYGDYETAKANTPEAAQPLEKWVTHQADKAPCTFKKALQGRNYTRDPCDDCEYRHNIGMECNDCPCHHACPARALRLCEYYNQRDEGLRAMQLTTNPDWLIRFSGTKDAAHYLPFPLIAWDEADELDTKIVDMFAYTIPLSKWKGWGLLEEEEWPDLSDLGDDHPLLQTETWIKGFLPRIARTIHNLIGDALDRVDETNSKAKRDDLWKKIRALKESLQQIRATIDIGDCVIDDHNGTPIIKPYKAHTYSKALFEQIGDIHLFMSATIRNPTVLARDLGLSEDDCVYIMVREHPFPVRNRLVQVETKHGSMSRKEQFLSRPKVLQRAADLIARYSDDQRRGLVLSYTTKLRDMLVEKWRAASGEDCDMGDDGTTLIWHWDYKQAIDLFRELYELDPEWACVVISTVNSGIDLPGGMADYLVVLKSPNQYLGDRWVRRRVKDKLDGWKWYQGKTAQALMQMCGRVVRGPHDKSDIHILDASVAKHLRDNRFKVYPQYFLDSIRIDGRDERLGQQQKKFKKISGNSGGNGRPKRAGRGVALKKGQISRAGQGSRATGQRATGGVSRATGGGMSASRKSGGGGGRQTTLNTGGGMAPSTGGGLSSTTNKSRRKPRMGSASRATKKNGD